FCFSPSFFLSLLPPSFLHFFLPFLPPSLPPSFLPSFYFHFCFFKTGSYHVAQAGFRLTEAPVCAYHQPRIKVVEKIPAAKLDGFSQDLIS
ncbi:hypothetical protein LEMLEM_LOCUS8523, partial [Lemmus lemmus]